MHKIVRAHTPWVYQEQSRAVLDGYYRLGTAIVLAAIADLKSSDPVKKMDALCWLFDDRSHEFMRELGFDTDPVSWIGTAQSKSGYRKLRTWRARK